MQLQSLSCGNQRFFFSTLSRDPSLLGLKFEVVSAVLTMIPVTNYNLNTFNILLLDTEQIIFCKKDLLQFLCSKIFTNVLSLARVKDVMVC